MGRQIRREMDPKLKGFLLTMSVANALFFLITLCFVDSIINFSYHGGLHGLYKAYSKDVPRGCGLRGTFCAVGPRVPRIRVISMELPSQSRGGCSVNYYNCAMLSWLTK